MITRIAYTYPIYKIIMDEFYPFHPNSNRDRWIDWLQTTYGARISDSISERGSLSLRYFEFDSEADAIIFKLKFNITDYKLR